MKHRKTIALIAALVVLASAPHRTRADDCDRSDDTNGIGLTLKLPVSFEKPFDHALSVVLGAGLEGNLTAFTSDYEASNAGFFAQLELRVYPRPRFRRGWLGLFVAQKGLYTNDGTSYEPSYRVRSVTSVGLMLGHKIWRGEHQTAGAGVLGMADIFFDIEMVIYRDVTRNCSREIEAENRMLWIYFGVSFGIANM